MIEEIQNFGIAWQALTSMIIKTVPWWIWVTLGVAGAYLMVKYGYCREGDSK